MPKFTKCQKCGRPVSKNCRSGSCSKCRDRSGENNPFFGKKHNQETIETTKEKLSEIGKQLWQDAGYRDKVIQGISNPRKASFSGEQSRRIAQWYRENPEQKAIRSEHMRQAWRDGKIEPNINSINESKDERMLLSEIKNLFPQKDVRKSTLKIDNRWLYPDIRIDKWIIIEFFGDYWHGNPLKYKAEDVLINGMTASQIWEKDKERNDFLRKNGFRVMTVWQNDYKNNKNKVLKEVSEWIKSFDGA